MGIYITLLLYLFTLYFIFQKDVFKGKSDDNDNNNVAKSEVDKIG